MNFNYSKSPEFNLIGKISDEYINLYGIKCVYHKTNKLQKDEIFGEHSRLSINDKDTFEIFLLPNESETYGGDSMIGVFGLTNQESLVAYVSKNTMKKIHPKIVDDIGNNFDYILGDIVVFDSGKIMEVSNFSCYVEGLNNLFVYNDSKNLYKITLKTYIGNTIEKTNLDNQEQFEKIENLEEVFELDTNKKEEVKKERKKTLKDSNDYNNVFGGF